MNENCPKHGEISQLWGTVPINGSGQIIGNRSGYPELVLNIIIISSYPVLHTPFSDAGFASYAWTRVSVMPVLVDDQVWGKRRSYKLKSQRSNERDAYPFITPTAIRLATMTAAATPNSITKTVIRNRTIPQVQPCSLPASFWRSFLLKILTRKLLLCRRWFPMTWIPYSSKVSLQLSLSETSSNLSSSHTILRLFRVSCCLHMKWRSILWVDFFCSADGKRVK